jgi:DNA-directed RNA polymerase subunit RPC12/RpoP
MDCPACHKCDRYFGPATFYIDEVEYEYVNCRRCGAMLLVGRDVNTAATMTPAGYMLGAPK